MWSTNTKMYTRMDNTRLTKQIRLWDYSKCRNKWSHEVNTFCFAEIGHSVVYCISMLFISKF